MSKIYIARQKIINLNGKIFAYELLFRDSKDDIKEFPTNIKATSQVMLNALTHMNLEQIMGADSLAFVNVDCEIIRSDILGLLDPQRFVIEILETTKITEPLLRNVAKLKKNGYKIALDDFDCSPEMIAKFQPLFKYLDFIKIDAITVYIDNLKKLIPKFRDAGLKLLIEKIENSKDYLFYKSLGFDLFQGYHIGMPETLELESSQEAIAPIVLNLISIIKKDAETAKLEKFIKQRPEIAYNIIKFINNNKNIRDNITSIVHAVTLMGRETLLRWLLVYLYSEVSANEFSEALLDAAIARAERMEERADIDIKEEAYMVGMFSMLDTLFEADMQDIFKHIRVAPIISNAVLFKSGRLGKGLIDAIKIEKDHFREILLANYDRINSADILITLEKNNIKY